MTQILVVKPRTLRAADKRLLREAGVVCVEADDPASVRMLQAEGPALDGNDLLSAALQAIAADKYSNNTADVFTKIIAAAIKLSVDDCA